MMLSRVAEHLRRGGGVLLPISTLAPGVSQAADPGSALVSGAVGVPWLIALGLIGLGCLALLSLLLAFGDASARRRRRVLRGRLDKLDLPAAISGLDGKLDWSNQAMRAAFGDGRGDILQTLGRGVGVDAGHVYRLANRAREVGFAFEPVRGLRDSDMAILSVRFDEPKHLVWMVFPPDRLPSFVKIVV
jgi:hypothetical protein